MAIIKPQCIFKNPMGNRNFESHLQAGNSSKPTEIPEVPIRNSMISIQTQCNIIKYPCKASFYDLIWLIYCVGCQCEKSNSCLSRVTNTDPSVVQLMPMHSFVLCSKQSQAGSQTVSPAQNLQAYKSIAKTPLLRAMQINKT